MSFLAPWFLLGILGIALPVWWHWRARELREPQAVPSLRLFEPAERPVARRRRIENPWLLLLRAALLCVAALAFSRPVWQLAAPPAGPKVGALHVLVVDASLSMTLGERFERGRRQAAALIERLPGRDWAMVVRAGAEARVVLEPTREHAALLRSLQDLEPGASRFTYSFGLAAVSRLIERALDQLASDPAAGALAARRPTRDVIVHLISDLQHSAAPDRFLDLLPEAGTRLVLHDTGTPEEGNWFIEPPRLVLGSAPPRRRVSAPGAGTGPAGPGPARAQLEVVVRGAATPEAKKTLHLRLDGRELGAETRTIPQHGFARYVFDGVEIPEGSTRVELELEPGDALVADDCYHSVLSASGPKRILFLGPSDAFAPDAFYYAEAIRSAAGHSFSVDVRRPGLLRAETEDAGLQAYALVVVSDTALPSELEPRLRHFVEAGGGLLMLVGSELSARGRRHLPITGHGLRPHSDAAASPRTGVEVTHPDHPALRGGAGWAELAVLDRVELVPEPSDQVLVRTSDGAPFLVEHRLGQGRVLLLAAPLDPEWSDLPLDPVFVPFVRASARWLAQVSDRLEAVRVDHVLSLRGPYVQVFDPSREPMLSLAETQSGGEVNLDRPGFYELREDGRERLIAVNGDPRESDVQRMDADLLERWRAQAQAGDASPEEPARTATSPASNAGASPTGAGRSTPRAAPASLAGPDRTANGAPLGRALLAGLFALVCIESMAANVARVRRSRGQV